METQNNLKLIKQGAEGRLYFTEYLNKPAIIKERFKKKYRNDVLDEHILKERIKAEAKGLLRSKIAGVRTPALYFADIESRKLYIEFINGSTVKDYIDTILTSKGLDENRELLELMKKIGSSIAKIHKQNLIHGDLTTSNMLVDESHEHLYLIDFGLSYVSSSDEDKGVDLYVLERALTSTHACSDDIFKNIIKAYKETYQSGCKNVLKKYDEVKARGRKRTMVG